MMNLAGLLIEGAPKVPADPEQAIGLIEALMQLGVPAAFDAMGSYYQRGVVVARGTPGQVERGASRSYAFWELAAYMGSSEAQAVLGDKMNALDDNPKEGWWANEEVALKMLECSYSQGNGKGAYRFGSEKTWAKDFSRGIAILHEGVKFGSERCANKLGVIFSGADIATGGPAADPAR